MTSISCGPLTSETDSVSIKKNIIIKKIMVKKFSNAQEVYIQQLLHHLVLDSDSETLKMFVFFFFF